MEREATRLGLASVSDYLRHLHRERVAASSEAALRADGSGQQDALADAHPASGIPPITKQPSARCSWATRFATCTTRRLNPWTW